MKKYVYILLILALLLGGCASKPTEQPAATTESTNIPTTAPTQATRSTAAPTTAPATAPTQPAELVNYEEYTKYNTTPKTCYVLRYEDDKSGGDYIYPGKAFSTAGMKDGALYIVHDGEVYLITEQYVTERFKTSEHIYYVLRDDAKKVWRTDLYGKDPVVVYESEYGDVTYLQYFGINAQGKLIIAENRNRIVMYDLQAKATEVLIEAYIISQFYYSPNGESFSYSEPMIFWKGKLTESDSEIEYTYYYFLNTGKQLQIHP